LESDEVFEQFLDPLVVIVLVLVHGIVFLVRGGLPVSQVCA
jgi:hypothetical protein